MSELFSGQPAGVSLAVALGLALGVAYTLSALAGRLTRALFTRLTGGTHDSVSALPSVRRPVQLVRVSVFVASALVLLPPTLGLAGVNLAYGLAPEVITAWVMGPGLRIALIAVAAYVLQRVVGVVVQRFQYELSQGTTHDVIERGKRARTLGDLMQNIAFVVIISVAGLTILRELQVDVMPLLTGAGIAGLAIGFGAQTLVKDIIAGFFIILENQVRVGDLAVINGTPGSVEQINLRTIVLRDIEGTVHVFPNGSIVTLANRSRDFAYHVFDVSIASAEDSDRTTALLKEVGDELARDPAFQPLVLEPLQVLGVETFDGAQIVLKTRIKTVPLKQWEVGRELRGRIHKKLEQSKIQRPHSSVTVHFENDELRMLTGMRDGKRPENGQ